MAGRHIKGHDKSGREKMDVVTIADKATITRRILLSFAKGLIAFLLVDKGLDSVPHFYLSTISLIVASSFGSILQIYHQYSILNI